MFCLNWLAHNWLDQKNHVLLSTETYILTEVHCTLNTYMWLAGYIPILLCIFRTASGAVCLLKLVGPEISFLPYLQANKLSFYYFMDTGRKHKPSGSKTKSTITHGIASNVSGSVSAFVSLSSKWKFQCIGPGERCACSHSAFSWGTQDRGICLFLASSEQAYALFGKRCHLISQSCCINNPA